MAWKTIMWSTGGLLIGALAILGIRFATYQPERIHYHANFGVYINGQKQTFDSPVYYLDGGCSMSGVVTPESRAHLTKGYDGVVHVQDQAVTWGQFFENLGWFVGDDFIKTSDGFYTTDGNNTLHILLNGQDYTGFGGITNFVINDQDKLLLSYGDDTKATLTSQYQSVPNTAAQDDGMASTSACGHTVKVTNRERWEHLL